MSVSALSTSVVQPTAQAGVMVAAKALDAARQEGDAAVKLIQSAPQPEKKGAIFDLYA